MCGRYALTLPPEAVRAYFGYVDQPNFPARYNIAPTQAVPVITGAGGERRFSLMRWGFLPGWVKDPKDFPLVINVRSETAREKPSFRNALARRRCLMPADGFYEWRREGKENRAFLFRRPDRGPFAFAAIHETWSGADGSEIDTVALMNTGANRLMSAIHHRCPIILDPADFDRWLDPGSRLDDLSALFAPPAEDLLEMVRVGALVNKASNDGPQLQEPPGSEADPPPPASPPPKPSAVRKPRAKAAAGAPGQGDLF
jgi:putative SOS response-associated peptidase YedK